MKKEKKKNSALLIILIIAGGMLVVGVFLCAILGAITIIAINPAENLKDTRNLQRSSDINHIENAVTQYTLEQGNSLQDFESIPYCPEKGKIGTDQVDLGAKLVPNYIVSVPIDPLNGDESDTGYTICQTLYGDITVEAPLKE